MVPERQNSPDVIEAHYIFALRMMHRIALRDKWIFIDEVIFNCSMRCRYGRSAIGTRANVVLPQIMCRNFSTAVEMSTTGLVMHKIIDRPFNA